MSARAQASVDAAQLIAKLPLGNAYWVTPHRLLAGEYPGGSSEEDTRVRLAALAEVGIDAFIDLTSPGERRPYEDLLPEATEYERFALRDHGLPDSREQMIDVLMALRDLLARGRRVYVHCRAGIGRTGMVVACHLIESGRDGETALRELNRLWLGSARSASWASVPETEEQVDYVIGWQACGATPGPADPGETATLAAAQKLRDRFHGAMLGLAAGDGLAAPNQFRKAGSFTAVGDMLGGGPYDLPQGGWSDDTAMALCLAESLLESSGFSARDQVARYARWQQDGHLSATGQCIGITASVARALAAAQWRRQPFAGSHDPKHLPPDPLTRVAPSVLYFFASPADAIAQAAEAARPTAQAPELLSACRLFAAMLHGALSGQPREQFLAPPRTLWGGPKLSLRIEQLAAGGWRELERNALKPAGDAIDLLTAALWAFTRSTDFRDGALAAVNLGGDADVIGTLYGQLAGAHYGAKAIPAAWAAVLRRRELLEDMADRLLAQAMVQLSDLP